MNDDAVRLLDIAISQAMRTTIHVVVAHGPADIVDPVVDAWIAECGFQWKLHVQVDLSDGGYRRGPVRHRDVAAALLAKVTGWRYIPQPCAMRTNWYGQVARTRNVLLRLNNADAAPQAGAFIDRTRHSLVIATSRRRFPGLVAENAGWVDLTPAPDPSRPALHSCARSLSGQDR